MSQDSTPLRIIRPREVRAKIGLSASAIDRRLDPESPQYDPEFPKPIPLSSSRRSGAPIGFIEHEVDHWLRQQIERSRSRDGRPAQSRSSVAA